MRSPNFSFAHATTSGRWFASLNAACCPSPRSARDACSNVFGLDKLNRRDNGTTFSDSSRVTGSADFICSGLKTAYITPDGGSLSSKGLAIESATLSLEIIPSCPSAIAFVTMASIPNVSASSCVK